MVRWYELHYEYEGCYDDGGVGHDSGWTRSKEMFDASSDEAARRKASKWAKERRAKAKPCGSFGCSNRGRTRVNYMKRIEHDEIRITLPKSVRAGLSL